MSGDQGAAFDAWASLKFAITELQMLAAALGPALAADEDGAAITWDEASWRAGDLLERTFADIGTLSAQYVRLAIIDRRGIDPLG